MHTNSHLGQFNVVNTSSNMFKGGGRKPDDPEKTHADTERTCPETSTDNDVNGRTNVPSGTTVKSINYTKNSSEQLHTQNTYLKLIKETQDIYFTTFTCYL